MASLQRYFVLSQDGFNRLEKRLPINLSSIDKQIFNIMQRKNLSPSTKWILYKNILRNFSKPVIYRPSTGVDVPKKSTMASSTSTNSYRALKQEEDNFKKRREKKDASTNTRLKLTKNVSINTDPYTDTSRKYNFNEDVIENEVTSDVEMENNSETLFPAEHIPNMELENYAHSLAMKEANQLNPLKIIPRKSKNIHEGLRIYDDIENHSTVTIDMEEANNQLAALENTPSPKKTRLRNRLVEFSSNTPKKKQNRTKKQKQKHINSITQWNVL